MALTLTAKLAASKSGTTVQNATSTFALGDMTGDEMHQTVYVSVGTSAVALPVGSIDTASDYWVLLRNVEDTTGTFTISFDAGTTEVMELAPGEVAGPFKVIGGEAVHVTPSASGIRIEVVACEP